MSRERPGQLCVVNGTDSGPGDWGRRTFTALEPCNGQADSSELLTTQTICANEAGQEFTERSSNDAGDCVTFKKVPLEKRTCLHVTKKKRKS